GGHRQTERAHICQWNHKSRTQHILGGRISVGGTIDASRFLFRAPVGRRRSEGGLRLASVQVLSQVKASRRSTSAESDDEFGPLNQGAEFSETSSPQRADDPAGYLQVSLTILRLVTRMSPDSTASF